jgi:signal transduction histidine kinase
MMSLGVLATTAIEAASLEAEKRKIQLISDIPDNLPEIYADEERMLQVFDNLLNNAIKFSPSGGPVNISISDIGHSLQVDVTDQGIGIPLDQHSKIWRRFYQVDGSATRRYNGLGLGLTIVKTVIERHGGKVSLNSEPGKGSTFTFTIPKIEMRAHRPIDQSLVVGSD